MTLEEQNELPKSTLYTMFWSHGMQVYHTLRLRNYVSCEMYTMGYGKDFEMFVTDSTFELPRMKKGGNRKQTLVIGVAALSRQNSFSSNSQVSLGPNGENTLGKRILDANGDQNAQNCINSDEEQLIASGEATVENVGMGTNKNQRTVTFELSQAQSGASSLTLTSPPLVSSDCLST